MNPVELTARRTAFRKLHEAGCFVIPNPWDIGSARYLCHLGFPALATSSAGFAFSRGLPDAAWAVPRDAALEHIADIVAAVAVPVNADFESGYAHQPDEVAQNVLLCAATGVAGLSIEDATGDPRAPLYDLPLAVERIRAARAALDAEPGGVLLTARAECFLVRHPDPLREAIRRLQAYSEAGADVLYAPGVQAPADIRTLVQALDPKPVNVLMLSDTGLTVADLADLGVRRISLGSTLARTAWGGFLRAVRPLAAEGSFAGIEGAAPFAELNNFFQEDSKRRRR
jgi:2-methylisocitrate lyase-like PEP mutase family enzyme